MCCLLLLLLVLVLVLVLSHAHKRGVHERVHKVVATGCKRLVACMHWWRGESAAENLQHRAALLRPQRFGVRRLAILVTNVQPGTLMVK